MYFTVRRLSLAQPRHSEDRVRAYLTLLIDGKFLVHDVRIVETNGGLLVAMPSKMLQVRCRACLRRNAVNASFCNWCGCRSPGGRQAAEEVAEGPMRIDLAHPLTPLVRKELESAVFNEYLKALEHGLQGGSQDNSGAEESL